uniref:Uncharacterized protein n=1 Tax=Arundo donax TaxID=35708 RepID=A0A0A9DII6_ARUDO
MWTRIGLSRLGHNYYNSFETKKYNKVAYIINK